ncbi:hypothetical protein F4780DRAFT_722508 [Xylariomycetidae sp. FL0641]|nr:hypothetical protein F4780DRAFT_722508 [Xylariomycetidae sp. FL0641]
MRWCGKRRWLVTMKTATMKKTTAATTAATTAERNAATTRTSTKLLVAAATATQSPLATRMSTSTQSPVKRKATKKDSGHTPEALRFSPGLLCTHSCPCLTISGVERRARWQELRVTRTMITRTVRALLQSRDMNER